MTVTKQQQLEWLAKECHAWKGRDFILVSDTELGYRLPVTAGCHLVTREEWQQERGKIQKQSDQAAQSAPDNSWHERGEFPPAGCECEIFVNKENRWINFESIAIRDGYVLGWCRERSCGFQGNNPSEFRPLRPLRTEREKAIDEMDAALRNRGSAISDVILGELYDAGFRKVNS